MLMTLSRAVGDLEGFQSLLFLWWAGQRTSVALKLKCLKIQKHFYWLHLHTNVFLYDVFSITNLVLWQSWDLKKINCVLINKLIFSFWTLTRSNYIKLPIKSTKLLCSQVEVDLKCNEANDLPTNSIKISHNTPKMWQMRRVLTLLKRLVFKLSNFR